MINKSELFSYDSDKLDRLTTVTGSVNQSIGYTSDKNGNISTKSDAGTYAYENTPYAVSKITSAQNISTTPQSISYYSFEKVKHIAEGTKTADFVYNADHQRIRMILKDNGAMTKTRWYFGHSCEMEYDGSDTTRYIWIGGDAYTAKAVAKKVGTGSWTVYNIFRDHLGTITHLKAGSTINEYSFDAWGRRRDKDTWTYTLSSEPALFADRGFTGHEYLEDFKLYNMNGRMYDPVVGRFLNADPVVQAPGSTQSYNRYSYCLNNPLKYTDPSGNNQTPWAYDPYSDGNTGGGGSNERFWERINGFFNHPGGGSSMHGSGGGGFGGHGGSGVGSYSYNPYSGIYTDYLGNVVSFDEVYNNYVVPNANGIYTITETATSLDGGRTFVGNGHYSLVRITDKIRATGNTFTLPNSNTSSVISNIQDGDIVGYGWSYGGTASIMGGGGLKNYDIWDVHGGHEMFSVPFGGIGVDISTEINFVWITSVDGKDFNVSDFSGSSAAMNVSVLWGGYSRTETSSYTMQEIGGTWGVLPFSITVTPGYAIPIGRQRWGLSITNNYLKTGGMY